MYKFAEVFRHGGPECIRYMEKMAVPTINAQQILVKIHAAAVNPVDTYIREGGHPLSRECPYTPGLDCGGEVIAVGKDVTEFQKGDRVFSCGSVSGTYATHGVFNADQLYPLPRHFTFQDGACIGTGYFTSLLYAHFAIQCAENIKDRCIYVHGGSGGVGSSLLKILLSMREVLPEYKNIQIAASYSKSDGKDKLLALGVDSALDRTSPDYLDNLKKLNSGKGPDVIFEMLANMNLPKDLDALNRRGEVIIIGDRGPVTINPRVMMEKNASVKGLMYTNQTSQQREEALKLFYELAHKCHDLMRPLISYEYSLKDADKAHVEVINHKRAGCGRIIINTEL